MEPITIVFMCVAIALTAGIVVKWLFKKDTEIENRRRSAAKLAGELTALGLVRLPEILVDYSVGDYSGVGKHVHDFIELLKGDKNAVLKEFSEVFDRLLYVKLQTEDGRALIAAKLEDATKDSDPNSVKDAPKAGAV